MNRGVYTFMIVCVLFVNLFFPVSKLQLAIASGPTLYVFPSTIDVEAGAMYNVSVMASHVENLWAWQSGLEWDPAFLEFVSSTKGDFGNLAGGDGIWLSPVNTTGRTSKPALQSGLRGWCTPVSAEEIKLMTFTFKAINNGTTSLQLIDGVLIGQDPTSFTMYPRWSDYNNDGRVDLRDVAYTLLAWKNDSYNQSADFNDDGLNDIIDIAIVTSDFAKLIGDPEWGFTNTIYNIFNPFVIRDLEPPDGATIGSTSLLISWKTPFNATSEVYIKPLNESTFTHIAAEPGTRHYVYVYNLSRSTDYVWYAYSKSLYGDATSNVRTLHVSYGVSFTQDVYTFYIERDYAQHAQVSVTNTDTQSHNLLAQASNPYEDLIVGFVGAGSIDQNITLAPGETKQIDLYIHAQDAVQETYTFSVNLTNIGAEEIMDYALVIVNVRQPNINLTMVEKSTDPITLSKTITVTNHGDPITDLYINASTELAGKVFFKPEVYHAYISTGQTLTFEVSPLLSTDFIGCQGSIIAVSAGRVITSLPVNFSLPSGKSVFLATMPRLSIRFSDYYDSDDSPNTNPLPTQPVESYLANGTIIFASQIIVDVYQNNMPTYGANVSLTVWNETGTVVSKTYAETDFTGKALFNVVGMVGNYSYQSELVGYGLVTEKRDFSVNASCLYEIRPNDITWLDVSDGNSTYNLTESMERIVLDQSPFTFRARIAATGENATFGLVLRWDVDVFKRVYILGSIQNETILTFQREGIPAGNFTALIYYYSPSTGILLSQPINISVTDSTTMYTQGNYTYYLPFPFNSTHFIRLLNERYVSTRDPKVAFDLINIEPADTTNSLYQLQYVIVSNETASKDFQFYANTTEGELYNTTFHLDLEPGILAKVNFTIPVSYPNGTLLETFDTTLSTDSSSVTIKITPQLSYIYDSRIWVGSQLGVLDPILCSIFPPYGLYLLYQHPLGREVITCGAFTFAGNVIGPVGDVIGIIKDGWDFFTQADEINKAIMVTTYLSAGFLFVIAGWEAAGAIGTVLVIGSLAQCAYDSIKVIGEAARGSSGIGICKLSEANVWYCTNRPEVSAKVSIDPNPEDVLQAAVSIRFSLPWSRDTYRPHNVHLFINGIEIGALLDTIPEGYYIFPFNSSILNFTPDGISENMIKLKMDNLNGGHYVVTTDWQLILHMKQVTLFVVATNQSEADSLLEHMSNIASSVPDFRIYPEDINYSDPNPKDGQKLALKTTVFNYGTAGMSSVPIDLYVDSAKVSSAIISFIPALTNRTVEFYWMATVGTHNITIKVNRDQTFPESDYSNNQAHKSITVGAGNIAVTNMLLPKNIIGQGYAININVAVKNENGFTETFNVTLYANTTKIETKEITLLNGTSTVLTFTWNTISYVKGNYTLWAYAWPVPGETDLADNMFTDGIVYLGIPGDLNADSIVDVFDAVILAAAAGSTPQAPNWNPNADINNDLIVDVFDAVILAAHAGQTDL